MAKHPNVAVEVVDDAAEIVEQSLPKVGKFEIEKLYKLSYVSHGGMQLKFFYFNDGTTVIKAVEYCREFCLRKGYKFIYVEPAITVV